MSGQPARDRPLRTHHQSINPMKLCHVMHGRLPMPPRGWAPLENSVCDMKFWCERLGHSFAIVNIANAAGIADAVNRIQPDVVHIHSEEQFGLAANLRGRVKILGCQWPLAFQPGHEAAAQWLFAGDSRICCLSEAMRDRCLALGVAPARLFLSRNGARGDLIRHAPEPKYPDKSICAGMINRRKRQHLLMAMPFVDIVGPIRPVKAEKDRPDFDPRSANYRGEWPHARLHDALTDYASLVLPSSYEIAPTIVGEALMAGLGVVVSEAGAANLDRRLPFITVVSEEVMASPGRLAEAIRENQQVARTMRDTIRQYAMDNFEWGRIVPAYLDHLAAFLDAR
jgi:glycosyltransferase involved in cell wall biosynthesis